MGEVLGDRADHDRARRRRGRPRPAAAARLSVTPPSSTTSRSPCTAHSASMPAARAARRTSSKTSVSVRRAGTEPRTTTTSPRAAQPSALARERTASSASARSTASTTRASSRASQAPRDLGGPGVDLGGGEGDLAGVAQHGAVDLGGVVRVHELVDVALDDLDGQPDQVDGLLQVDDAGQGPRGGAEDRGGQGVAAGGRVAVVRRTSRRSPGCRPGRSARPTSGPRR